MAKKKNGDRDEQRVVAAITKNALLLLHRKVKAARREMDGEKASIGGMISDAVENKHLHKKAFAFVERVDRMAPSKRSEYLFAIDLYRTWFPDWDKQLDLFRANGGADEPEPDIELEDGAEAGSADFEEDEPRATH